MEIIRIPIGKSIELAIDLFTEHMSFITKAFSEITENGIDILVNGMMFFPTWVLIGFFTALAYSLSRKKGITRLR
jgi:glycine betaine/proline transport system permease protein